MNAATLENVAHLVPIIFYLVGVYVGISGLRAWKKEYAGKANHDLAKQILNCI